MSRPVLLYGASGQTGQFVAQELCRRGWPVILSGRDAARLEPLAARLGLAEPRPASIDDDDALDFALSGAGVVLNCAGPFRRTAPPLIAAALRAGIPYLDVAAEIEAILDTMTDWDAPARAAGVAVVPAMAFYGGLGDLLATHALGDWEAADEIILAYGLSDWIPTDGTRLAGAVSRERRGGRRPVYTGGRLLYRKDALPITEWTFPDPIGRQRAVGELTMADSVTIPHHIRVPEIRSYMTAGALEDLARPDTKREPTDESGRTSQRFAVEVTVRRGNEVRHGIAGGRDIYAISAPLLVEAAALVVTNGQTGVLTAGRIGERGQLLSALEPHLDRLCC